VLYEPDERRDTRPGASPSPSPAVEDLR